MALFLGGGGKRLVGSALFLLAALASSDARAFCQTTTASPPRSYRPSQGCFTEGLPVYWKNACVGYSVQSDASIHVSYDEAVDIIDTAFQAWTTATCDGSPVGIAASNTGSVTCNEVGYNSPESNGRRGNQNLIVFRDRSWPYEDGATDTLGLTTLTLNLETGEILDADLEINASRGNFSTTDTVPSDGFDLLSVVTHEVGHFFGLAHARDPMSTMFASYQSGSSELRSLTEDDVAGICAIYPTATTRSGGASGLVAADACDPTPKHGFIQNCAEPVTDAGGCSLAPTTSGCSSAMAAVVVGVGLVLRRHRRLALRDRRSSITRLRASSPEAGRSRCCSRSTPA
jgi:Matrixin